MAIYAPSDLQKSEGNRKNSEKDYVGDISNSRSRFQNNMLHKYHRAKDATLDFIVDAKDAVVEVLQDTKIEIYAGAAAGLIVAGVWSYKAEEAKNKCLKLSYSEKTEQTSNMTNFLRNSNDFYMSVFGAHNDSWTDPNIKTNTKSFGQALKRRFDPTEVVSRPEIPKLGTLAIQYADSVLNDAKYLRNLQNEVGAAVTSMGKAWDDYHHDEYHTEVYYTTSVDSKGNSSTTMHTRSVYDWTDNTYKYYSASGNEASYILDNIKKKYPKVKTDNMFILASKVSEDNREAIINTRKDETKEKPLSEAQILAIANNSITGSRQYEDYPTLEGLRVRLMSHGNTWRQHKNTARSYSQRTYNGSHAESAEFKTSENVIGTGTDLYNLVNGTLSSVISAKARIPKITSMMITYQDNYASLEKAKEMKKLKKEILSESKDGYYELFSKGTPLEPAKWWHVVLFTLLGGAIGGALGAGLDFAGDRTNLYSGREDDRYSRRKKKEEERSQRDFMKQSYYTRY